MWLTALYIAIIMALTFLSIFFVAKSNPDTKPYNTKTGPFFYAWSAYFIWNIFWGWNYWKVPTKERIKN